MKSILRSINRIPFKLTLKHYFPLGVQNVALAGMRLDSPEAWDELRRSHPHFETPDTRDAWIASLLDPRDGQGRGIPERARDIATLMRAMHVDSAHSAGVGSASLEYYLLQEMPNLKLTISEFNDESVKRLNSVYPEAHPRKFNVLRDSWLPDGHDLHKFVVMYRLDPQLTDEEWRVVFQHMYRDGVENVLYIPANFLTLRYIVRERSRSIMSMFKGIPTSFAGYVRTQKVFESYWEDLYRQRIVTIGGKPSYLLTRQHHV